MTGLLSVFLMGWLAQTTQPAPPPAGTPPPIQDNSFLIEEAYNQERGVVQHLTTFQLDTRSDTWAMSFTQEWPVPGQTHQLSVTLAGLKTDRSPDGSTFGAGDVAVNYRYQLVSGGRTAVAPRFSVLLPTGDYRRERGAGAVGYQVNLPISVELGRRMATHINGGATVIPGAKNDLAESATTWGVNLGQSFVWLLHPNFNALVEVLYLHTNAVVGQGATAGTDDVWVNPGIRGAINCRCGLQVVPGFSVPLGVGPSAGQRAVFFYLSFEHRMFGSH